jgi:hypothetical protein
LPTVGNFANSWNLCQQLETLVTDICQLSARRVAVDEVESSEGTRTRASEVNDSQGLSTLDYVVCRLTLRIKKIKYDRPNHSPQQDTATPCKNRR